MPPPLPPTQPRQQPPQAHHVHVVRILEQRALSGSPDLARLANSRTRRCAQPVRLASHVSRILWLNKSGRDPAAEHHVGNGFPQYLTAAPHDSAQARFHNPRPSINQRVVLDRHRLPDRVPRLPHASPRHPPAQHGSHDLVRVPRPRQPRSTQRQQQPHQRPAPPPPRPRAHGPPPRLLGAPAAAFLGRAAGPAGLRRQPPRRHGTPERGVQRPPRLLLGCCRYRLRAGRQPARARAGLAQHLLLCYRGHSHHLCCSYWRCQRDGHEHERRHRGADAHHAGRQPR